MKKILILGIGFCIAGITATHLQAQESPNGCALIQLKPKKDPDRDVKTIEKFGDLEIRVDDHYEPDNVSSESGTISFAFHPGKSGCQLKSVDFGEGLWITSDHRRALLLWSGPEESQVDIYDTTTCKLVKRVYFGDLSASPSPQITRKPFCHPQCDAYCDCYAAEIYAFDSRCDVALKDSESQALTKSAFGDAFKGIRKYPANSPVVKKNLPSH